MLERIMNKKNYKQNLKKSFILCGIMLAIILLIFVFAANVNNNVAENMVGRMIYTSADNGGIKAYIYDFDKKIKTELTQFYGYGDLKRLQFIDADMVAGICIKDGVAGIYSSQLDGQATMLHQMDNVKEVTAFDCDDKGENILVAYEDTYGKSNVFSLTLNGNVITYMSDDDKKVTGACFSHDNKNVLISVLSENTVIYSSKISGTPLNAECMIKKDDAAIVSAYDKGFFIQHESDVSRYISVKEYENTLDFCEDEYKYYGLCDVTDKKFIIASDINGNMDIYVCNGSNMDSVDAVNDELDNIPMDYLQVKE